jgi:hypothetical protein
VAARAHAQPPPPVDVALAERLRKLVGARESLVAGGAAAFEPGAIDAVFGRARARPDVRCHSRTATDRG